MPVQHKGPRLAGVRQTTTFLGERMKTGQDVVVTGLYASDCCGEEVLLEKDASFPRCVKCESLSTWELVDLPTEKAA